MKIRSNVKISGEPNNSLEVYKDGLYSKNLEKEVERNHESLKAYAQANNRFADQTTETYKNLSDRLTKVEKGGDPQTITNIENRLNKLEKNSDGTTTVTKTEPALERKVSLLEAKVDGQQNVLKINLDRQQTIDELFKQYNKRFDDLETKVKDLTKLMTSLSNAVLVIQKSLGETE